ncbi:hypothetical protein [Streptosporangium saharense]|uniref:hypothetical protein n=1 Tax=Streptosporangium saharense TaxID=1706840 RepID=UPI00341B0DE0
MSEAGGDGSPLPELGEQPLALRFPQARFLLVMSDASVLSSIGYFPIPIVFLGMVALVAVITVVWA